MKRLTLSGYYGYGNAGDEAVLAGLVQGFHTARPAGDLELVALSGDPAETARMHGIGATDRYKPAALVRAIARSDVFLSGGGSLLQDVTSAHSLFYYLGVVRLAQMLGKPTMFIAQGIGPLALPRSRRLTASVANRLKAITVRDSDSAQLLRDIGVTKPPIEVTADPALLLGPESQQRTEGTFGVALRPWHRQEKLADHVAEACRRVFGERHALLITMQPRADTVVMEQFSRKWHQGKQTTLSPAESGLPALLTGLASCEIVIGMRLHALILAAACGVPSVALSYDPKVDAFMRASGQGDAVSDLQFSDSDAFAVLLARVWAERHARADALKMALPDLRARAMRNVDVALGL